MPRITEPLKDLQVKNAKPQDKSHKLADSGGLYLLVKPTGRKGWRFKYRFQGTEKLLSLGAYLEVGLQEARKKRDANKKLLADGIHAVSITVKHQHTLFLLVNSAISASEEITIR